MLNLAIARGTLSLRVAALLHDLRSGSRLRDYAEAQVKDCVVVMSFQRLSVNCIIVY